MSQVLLRAAPALGVHPVTGRIGAEIEDIRLGGELSDDSIAAIKEALVRHKVLFFRNQQHLDDAGQERFGRRLGELIAHPTNPVHAGSHAILELDGSKGGGRADQWHTDITFLDVYPKASVLRAVIAPGFGGDTVWANTVAAYQDLSPALQRLADELWALHSNAYDYGAQRPNATAEDRRNFDEVFTSTVYETEHPVVRVHPESGERSLVLGSFVQRILGHSRADSQRLYEVLQSHVTRIENTVRWRWRAGDVAIWDNRATQHRAVNDYADQPRVVRRVTIAGEAPVGVDGRRSSLRRSYRKAAGAH